MAAGRGAAALAAGFSTTTLPRIEATRPVPRSSWSSAARLVSAPRTPPVRRPDMAAGATTTCRPVTRENSVSAGRRSDAAMSKRIARLAAASPDGWACAMAGAASAIVSENNDTPLM
jgi:hypothetical protein